MRTLVDCCAVEHRAEVIAGSTRLKAGTATKIALNLLTTSAMIRIGKT
jgi:N-acetylmuramic acid 6-phosphate etherase